MASVPQLLYNTLDDLARDDLKRFRSLLHHHGHIKAGKLNNADVTVMVDMMLEYYGPKEAGEITLNILRKMNQNQLALDLETKYKEVLNSLEEVEKQTRKQEDFWLQELLKTHKKNTKEKVEHIFDEKNRQNVFLTDYYTELFITEGDINQEHEILKIDVAFKPRKSQERPIKCNDVFSLNKNEKKIVLTKGIAGIGKTISVYKFILDWTEGKANQDVDFVFLLPLRKMNCIKDEKISLHEFLQKFNPELRGLETTKIYGCKLAFIFDGMDESRLTLEFHKGMVTNIDERSSVDQLFTSLVNGSLLPSALVWVTSRPAAANQIPPEYVGLVTEVQGFTDQQKVEYFRRRIKDEAQASRIISHIKKSRSLYIMCYIPVFCWIIAAVFQHLSAGNNAENIGTTLTEMYIHFLLIQMKMKSQKCDQITEREHTKLLDSNKTTILKLAKLAFEQLKKENIVFCEEDLKACGIDVSQDIESTGMLTEIFQQEAGLHEMKVFCFVHLSVQEFLAAVHVFLCHRNKNMEELQFFSEEPQKSVRVSFTQFLSRNTHKNIALHKLLKKAVKKAMQSQKGHLDLFLRFLLGISLETNQKLLRGLFTNTEDSKYSSTDVTQYITEQLKSQDISPETSINMFYCVLELKDNLLNTEIQRYFTSSPEKSLSSSMCSLLAYTLMMSEKVLEELNLNMYKTSYGGYMRLLQAVRCCRKAKLSSCNLNHTCCETVALALQIQNSPLIELDMSHNDLQDSGVKLLSEGLKSPNCQLKTLRLSDCTLTGQSCEFVASVLQLSNSHLIELDVSENELQDSGVKWLFEGLRSLNCQLKILRLSCCTLTSECCEFVASALQSSNSRLTELDMSRNDLQDSGVKLISDGLKSPSCQLKILRLTGCKLTGQCCEFVSSVLQSSNSRLTELDMSRNELQDSGVKLISDGLKSPSCQLKILRLADCALTGQCCEFVASALQSSNSPLIELDMNGNTLKDSGVKLLSDGLKSPNCHLEILRLSICRVTDEGCGYLASALRSNPSALRELDLSYNSLGESEVKMFSDLQNDLNCALTKLDISV